MRCATSLKVCMLAVVVLHATLHEAVPTSLVEAMVLVDQHEFVMGSREPVGDELAAQTVMLDSYYIDATTVTNEEFREFVKDTKFKTESETFSWSFVLAYHATQAALASEPQSVEGATHWLAVEGATWRRPNGPGSNLDGLGQHPVVHVSYNDAVAYCKWAGKRLPTETEWEAAARGGLEQEAYPWGSEPPRVRGDGHLHTWKYNVWQGGFPTENTKEDGYSATCEADAFEPNALGVYNMVGNVWEWTRTVDREKDQVVLRGGSFVDSEDGSFNHKANVNTRMGNSKDSAGTNMGFRCALSAEKKGKGKRKKGYHYKKHSPQQQKRRGGGGGAAPSGMDQALMQKIVEEHGVEGLQEYLTQSGIGGHVMTPQQLKERQEELQKMKEQMKAEL